MFVVHEYRTRVICMPNENQKVGVGEDDYSNPSLEFIEVQDHEGGHKTFIYRDPQGGEPAYVRKIKDLIREIGRNGK